VLDRAAERISNLDHRPDPTRSKIAYRPTLLPGPSSDFGGAAGKVASD